MDAGLPDCFSAYYGRSPVLPVPEESYPDALTIINSLGVSAAGLVLLTEIIILLKV